MKILSLNFKNIHSLKGENTIDFRKSPLLNSGIFAIIGPTGAGKSTILDIITLALYNRTPRMGTLSKNMVKSYGSIITRNTEDCFAEIEYEVKGKQYRSKWEISTSRTGELRDYEMELAEVETNNILSVKKSDVPNLNASLIGLSYEQFVKSIVLSQGEFAKFLKASPDERSDLLEKITGTEIYRRIGKAAFDKYKAEKTLLDNIKIKLEGITVFNEQEINDLQNNKLENETLVKDFNLELTDLNKIFAIKQNIKNLEITKSKLLTQFTEIEKQITAFEPQIVRLAKHEKLINLKSNILELKNNYTLQKNNTDKLNIVENKNENNNISIHDNESKYEKYKLENEKLIETEKILLPKIIKTRELDIEIKNITLQIKQQRELFLKQSDSYTEVQERIKEIEQKKESDKNLLQKSENWQTENIILEDLEKEFSLIKERIENFETEAQNVDSLIRKLTNKDLQKEIFKSEQWDLRLEYIENFISTNKKLASQIISSLNYKPDEKNEINQELELLKTNHNELKNLLQLSENQHKNKIKVEELLIQKKQLLIQIAEDESFISKLKAEIEILEKYIEELKIRKERQQLEAKYSEDRSKLILGEPCYLCGSKEHPYIKSYENKLDETTKLLKQKETDFKTKNLSLQNYSKSLITNQSILSSNNKSVNELSEDIKKYELEFESINSLNKLKCDINKSEEIKLNISHTIEQGKVLKHQMDLINKLSDLQIVIDGAANFSEKILNVNQLKVSLKNYLSKYKKYIDLKTDYSEIIKIFEQNINRLNKSKEQILQLKNNISLNTNVIKEKKELLESMKVELTEKKNQLDVSKLQNEELKKQRFELLENKTPEEIENKLKKDLKEFSEKIASQNNILTKFRTDKQNFENNILELKQEIEIINQNIKNQEEFLLPKLNVEGFLTIDEALKNILNKEEIEKIKLKENDLRDKKISIQQSLKDNTEEIEKQKIGDSTQYNYEEVLKTINEKKQTIEEKNREIGIIKNKIDEDAKRRVEVNLLNENKKAQDKEVNRWNDLNEMIGDAQGKRFTLIAQQLTLNELINFSNIHLKHLNDRYILKKSDNSIRENLIVIDTYMGNTERSVQTLSGGESFLLSLSLALGLSDLASKNTKIECLFIDEGFGTLDQQTLDSAIATLEELQNQTKRTICIISHVQSIKDRISTQIELKKINSGFSSIEIRS